MIPLIDLKLNTFQMLTVGRQRSMNEYAKVTINANGLGTSAMTEGQVLLLTIAFVILITLLTNAVVAVFI
tara:strand:+ start:417 stop:626 length:210 start_codon:yes stop_codon:yes gene_type:complete